MYKIVLSLFLIGCVEVTPYTKNEDFVSLNEVVLSWEPFNSARPGIGSGTGIPAPYRNAQKKVYVNNPFKSEARVRVDCGFEFNLKVPPQSSVPIFLQADPNWPWLESCRILSAWVQ